MSKYYNRTKMGIGICFTLGFLFCIATFDMDYGYYEFLRIFAFAMSLLCAFILYRRQGFSIAHIPIIAIAVLWNPIAPIYMDKEAWVVFDIIAAVIEFAIATYMYYKKPDTTE